MSAALIMDDAMSDTSSFVAIVSFPRSLSDLTKSKCRAMSVERIAEMIIWRSCVNSSLENCARKLRSGRTSSVNVRLECRFSSTDLLL